MGIYLRFKAAGMDIKLQNLPPQFAGIEGGPVNKRFQVKNMPEKLGSENLSGGANLSLYPVGI